jgi:phosphoribosylglycinamide formyltransferase 1
MGISLGILISGRGSNMLNIVDACLKKKINAEVKIIISNNTKSNYLEKLKNSSVKIKVIQNKDFKNNNLYEEKIGTMLKSEKVELVCLAGYTRVLSKNFLNNWKNQVINIHPSLLPSFKGLNAQEKAFNYRVKYTGCTVHYVNEELDGGEIIDQRVVEIKDDDDIDSLKKKILKEEHKLYINVIDKLSKKGL